jgi:HAD superfamily hydrolase (TIGR01509 family)
MIAGVIFDMDGVLVDTEEWICRAATAMFAEKGLTVRPEDFRPFIGAGENRYLGGVAEKYGLELDLDRDKARTYDIYAEIVKGQLQPLPGVRRFLDRCRGRDLKLALATSADEVKMRVNLREIGLSAGTFEAAVNGLDVERKKPDPQIFLLASAKLGLDPRRCLIVEDAVNGVAAARAAGARCLALTTSFSAGDLAGADWIAPSLAEAPEAALDW